jgi:hypothetical protein
MLVLLTNACDAMACWRGGGRTALNRTNRTTGGGTNDVWVVVGVCAWAGRTVGRWRRRAHPTGGHVDDDTTSEVNDAVLGDHAAQTMCATGR